MQAVGLSLSGIAVIVGFVCYILVLVKMFQNGQTGLGVACIILGCCGLGELITFILGWVNHRKWGITNIMLAWTVAAILGAVGSALNPGQFQQFQQQVPLGR